MSPALAEPIHGITTNGTGPSNGHVISPPSTGPSIARAEASRANGRRSHGPTSLEGKECSRRNGCKEGLTGAGIVLPPDAAKEVERRQEEYVCLFGSRNAVERELIRQMALGSWRSEVLSMRINENDARTCAARFANWEQDQQLAAGEIGRRLGEDPELAVVRLQRSSAGCDWLIGRWTLLGNGLSSAAEGGPGCIWTDADLALALDLLGLPAVLRHLDRRPKHLESLREQARSGLDEAVIELREFIQKEVAALERRREEAWEGIEQPWLQDISSGLGADLGPDGTRLLRYEMAATRLFHSAWSKLERLRKDCGEPLFPHGQRGLAAGAVARPAPLAVPVSEPVPPAPPPPTPAPAPVHAAPAVTAPAWLDDPSPVLDVWICGPPRTGVSLASLLQNKTNPTPSLPANGGRAARHRKHA